MIIEYSHLSTGGIFPQIQETNSNIHRSSFDHWKLALITCLKLYQDAKYFILIIWQITARSLKNIFNICKIVILWKYFLEKDFSWKMQLLLFVNWRYLLKAISEKQLSRYIFLNYSNFADVDSVAFFVSKIFNKDCQKSSSLVNFMLRIILLSNSSWMQLKLAHMRCLEDLLDVLRTSCVCSIYVLYSQKSFA